MKKYILLGFIPLSLFSFDIDPAKYGLDYSKCDSVIGKESFNICYSNENKGPLYVNYYTSDFFKDKKIIKKKFILKEEELLKEKDRAKIEDYQKQNKFYPTKLAPTLSSSFTFKSKEDTYSLANTVPMNDATFQLWKSLEDYEAKIIDKYKKIYINAGVIYFKKLKLGTIKIPKGFYKTYYAPIAGKMIAFYFPHSETVTESNIHRFERSIDQIEQITGIDFYKNAKEDELEKKRSYF